MNYKYDVSVILVNYNGKRYIDNLFESLCNLNHNGFSFEVIFEDNDSSDGSVEYLQEAGYGERINLKIIQSKENLGFAGGNNLAAKSSQGRYLVLLNNDTKVDPNWLQELYDFMEARDDVVMTNSKLLFFYDFISIRFHTDDKIFLAKQITINGQEYVIDNKFCKNILYEEQGITCFGHSEICIPLLEGDTDYNMKFLFIEPGKQNEVMYVGGEAFSLDKMEEVSIDISKFHILENKFSLVQNAGSGVNETFDGYDIGFAQKDEEQFSEIKEINNGCGASVMIRREAFMDCGGFDERFFMYYEDTDLSYRLKKGGKKIMYCPTSLVRHIHTGSSKEWSPFFTYQVYRNKLLFIYKNISKREFWKYFKEHYRQGKNEKNPYKLQGCKDCIKIILGFRNVKFKADR